MVHPIDVPSRREHDSHTLDRERPTTTDGIGWSALLTLVIVAIFVVALVFSLTSGEEAPLPQEEQRTESPAIRGE